MANSRSRPSPDLSGPIAAALAAHCTDGSRLLLGYSGGLDSTVLLHGLASLRAQHGWRVECAHVHHGLSPNADRWADFCAAQCRLLDLPFSVLRVEVSRVSPDGLECAARDARYAALHAHARDRGLDTLLTAHHADDQAETLLHNMVRGAGLLGLAGMPAWRAADADRVATLRPLLGVPRSALEAHAQAHGLGWIDDESNADTRYARNYLRRDVLPVLTARWPRAAEAMSGVARRLAEAQTLLDGLAARDAEALAETTQWGRCYRLDGLIALDAARQRNLLRWLLRQHGARTLPNEPWLDEWRRQLAVAQATSACPVAHAGVAGISHRGALWLMPDFDPPAERKWSGEPVQAWGAGQIRFEPVSGQGLAASVVAQGHVTVRARAPGDRLPRGPGRPRAGIKQIAQECGLPPWLRDRVPIVCVDGRPVWMPGCDIAPPFLAAADETGWLPRWHPAG